MRKMSLGLSIFMILAFGGMMAYGDKLSSYPLTGTLNNADTFPIVASAANKNVNWSSLKNLMSSAINWSDVQATVPSSSINWTDVQAVAKTLTGINWSTMSVQGNGINWAKAANGATATTLMCWRSDGFPGKCTTGVSGVACTACQ